jgi:hypothetical protein
MSNAVSSRRVNNSFILPSIDNAGGNLSYNAFYSIGGGPSYTDDTVAAVRSACL